jgi:hypothetical protein
MEYGNLTVAGGAIFILKKKKKALSLNFIFLFFAGHDCTQIM